MAGEVLSLLTSILAPHGPPVGAKLSSYAPGDYSIHFFLQLALIVVACRGVGWFCRKFLAQPQVVGEMIDGVILVPRSEEHTSDLQSLMRSSYAVFCLKKEPELAL